jgi:purine nucleosidase
MATKVILDTDIGTDIDDAICLTYLLNNPKCELLGITTVTGQPELRAMIASSLCKYAGKDIPIYPGFSDPMKIEQRQKIAVQAKSLNKWPHETNFPKGEAVEFLRKTIRANPGEVTLLTIGPLTNIGVLFNLDPEIPSLLKSLVMMCGYYQFHFKGKRKLEWNAIGDYHASDIVFKSKPHLVRAIGLDVTMKVTMTSDEFKNKFSAEPFRPLQDYAQHWYQLHSPSVTFHDPLAGTIIFKPDICKFIKGDISIAMKGNKKKGKTIFNQNPTGKHEIAVSVDNQKFFDEYLSVFK